MNNRKKGFSLVELLVVVAIITILAGLLLPALSKSREQARRATCVNNLRQIGMAVVMYTNEFNDVMPGVYDGGGRGQIYLKLNEYLGNRGVFWCPSSGEDRKWDGVSVIAWNGRASYGFNAFGTGIVPGNNGAGEGHSGCMNFYDYHSIPKRSALIVNPAEMIVAADSLKDGSQEFHCALEYLPSFIPSDIHQRGSNVLFFDGHVGWYPLNKLISAFGNVWKMWNYDNQPIDYPDD